MSNQMYGSPKLPFFTKINYVLNSINNTTKNYINRELDIKYY